MVFTIFSCLFVKEIQNEVSAGFYESLTLLIEKFLPVTLFRELVPAF
jgi:hypothetical protein